MENFSTPLCGRKLCFFCRKLTRVEASWITLLKTIFRIDISIRVIFHEYLPWIKRILNNMANKGYLRPILFLDLLKANCYYSASDGKKWKWWFWKIYIFHKLYVSLTEIPTWKMTGSFATIQSFICPLILIFWAV